MSAPVISVSGLGKAYASAYDKKTLMRRLLSGQPDPDRLRWVLRNITFDVHRGQAVGLIGVNGAGKSTLLKMLAGTTRATEGALQIQGTVSALLELGLGFHGDFTGRQNAYMSGQMTGRSRAEMDAVMDEIEAFAEVGDYFDWPVRTYSSGMQVRVAFAVATAFRPDVLIIDEALAVGDAYFQHKSFARIRQFREDGVTLLFVSHDPGAIKSLCDRAILLGAGGVIQDGDPVEVLDYYYAMISAREGAAEAAGRQSDYGKRSGNGKAHMVSAQMLGAQDTNAVDQPMFRVGEAARLRVEIEVTERLPGLTLGMTIRDRTGYDVFGMNTRRMGWPDIGLQPGTRQVIEFVLPNLAIGPGHYHISMALHDDDHHVAGNYDRWDQALIFEVTHGTEVAFAGVAALPVEVRVTPLAASGQVALADSSR